MLSRCTARPAIGVKIYRRGWVAPSRGWKEFASVETILSPGMSPAQGTSYSTIPWCNVILIVFKDEKQLIAVTFDIRSRLIDPPSGIDTPSAEHSNVLSKVKAAHEKLETKTVILDKLGKARSVVNILKLVGDALGDVKISS